MDKPKGISIIICFYNSTSRLEPTLKSIIAQTGLNDVSWELVLVDNASTDGSMDMAVDLLKSHDFVNYVGVAEMNPGLNYARKKGMETAQYEYILFCDDDNWLRPTYLKTAFEFLEHYPDYGVVGGNGAPVCEVQPPQWFERYASIYATGCRGNEDVTNVYGAGMTLRKSLLNDFEPLIEDRKGNALTGGGDTEICDHITGKGFRIKQLCDNTFKHFIPKERLTTSFLKRTAYGRGFSRGEITFQRHDRNVEKLGIKYRFKLQFKKIIKALFLFQRPVLIYEYQYLKGYYHFYKSVKTI